MDIHVLENYIVIAQEGNITKAAATLHIAQSSLSKQILDLEAELGKQLFIRGKRHITLTQDGLHLYHRAIELVDLMHKTQQEIMIDTYEVDGQITFGGTLNQQVLALTQSFHTCYPKVNYHFYSSDAVDIMQRLDSGTIDYAILLEPVDVSKYDYIPLNHQIHWGIIVNHKDTLNNKEFITPEDLPMLPLVIHQRIEIQHYLANWANVALNQLNIIATYNVLNTNPTIFAQSDFGYLVTTNEAMIDTENYRFIPFYPYLPMSFALVWKHHPTFNKPAQLFLESIRNNNKQE